MTMRHRLHNRLPQWHRRTIYALAGVLVVTGLGWLVVAYLLAPAGEPVPAPHPWAGTMLALHGVAAYAALVSFALVGHVHMRTGWRVPELRSAAFWLCAMILVLALTGLGFYYVAAEQAASFLRWSHVVAGLLLPGWLALHIIRGRRVTRRT
jgi:Opacity-associated protein A N-terminal motif